MIGLLYHNKLNFI